MPAWVRDWRVAASRAALLVESTQMMRCYRALVEICLAGGDVLADRSLLADPATTALRGRNALPSMPTLWRFLAGADLGWVAKAAAVNRVMLRWAWAWAWAAGAARPGTG